MSLRIRLTLIISLLFLCSMLLGVTFLVLSARQRVANEVQATATLTFQLLDALLPASAGSEGSDDTLLTQLAAMDGFRHMEIRINQAGEVQDAPSDAAEGDAPSAPAWFTRLVRGEDQVFTHPLGNRQGDSITVRTRQADEIAEVWEETRVFLVLLGLVLLTLNGILYLIIGRWFAPVRTILDSLADVEQGGSGSELSSGALPELQVIANRVRGLGSVLRQSRADNEQLTRRSLSIQEEERRHLAQELHDEMGQSISAIKAIAFSIAERSSDDAMSREGATRIGSIANNVRDHIRSMMQRLRPAVLDELGLQVALEVMVDEWNRNHTSCFCSLRVAGDTTPLDAEQQIHLYRIVQEALTNVAAHSGAEQVEVTLHCNGGTSLQIHDNGLGFATHSVRPGMGLSGMQERVAAMGGSWRLDTAPGEGVTIRVHVPNASDHVAI